MKFQSKVGTHSLLGVFLTVAVVLRKVSRVDKHAPFLHAQKIVYISPNETLVQVQVFAVIELDQVISDIVVIIIVSAVEISVCSI